MTYFSHSKNFYLQQLFDNRNFMVKEKAKSKKHENIKTTASSYKWLPVVFFLMAFFVYANTLKHEYALDDDIYTRKNTFIQKGISSFSDLVGKGTLVGFDGTNVSDYRPLIMVNFALEKSLFGNKPAANHFFNVLFYALLCAFLFVFLKKLFKDYPVFVPALITALFVLHPLHTEVVANIKSRDELLCMFFGLLALKDIFDYQQNNKIRFLIYSCIAFFLSLSCKESGFAYLGLIPLVLYFFTDASLKRIALLTTPFVAVAAINLLIRVSILDSLLLHKTLVVMDNSLMAATNATDSLATNFTMLFHALTLLFFPVTLSWDYSFNQFPIVSWSDATAIASLLIHLGLLVFAMATFKKKNIFSFAILFYFVASFITSNLLIKIGSSFSERFLFTPSLAFCIVLPFLLAKLFKLDLKNSTLSNASKLVGIIAVVCLLFAFKTVDRNPVWKNNSTLFASGVETSPNSARTHYAYANEFREKVEASTDPYEKGEAAKTALSEFNKGLAIYPNDERIYYNMGVVYYATGDIDNATKMYKRALQLKPDYAEALNNYGVIIFNTKDYTNALSYFIKSTKSKSDYTDAFANAGACYFNMKDFKGSIPYFEGALKINPANVNVMRNLAMVYTNLGDTAKANYYTTQSNLY